MKVLSISQGNFIAGVNDDDVVGTSPDLSRYDVLMLEADQPVDVEGSLDGRNFASTVLALQDVHVAASPGTLVLVTAANKIYRIVPGAKFTKVRIKQKGASAVTVCRLLLGRTRGD